MVPDRETEFLGTPPRFKKKFLEELFPSRRYKILFLLTRAGLVKERAYFYLNK